jgi:hypothetical protein
MQSDSPYSGEDRPPIFFGFQTDVVLSIEKSGCAGAIVSPASLTRGLSYFREGS